MMSDTTIVVLMILFAFESWVLVTNCRLDVRSHTGRVSRWACGSAIDQSGK